MRSLEALHQQLISLDGAGYGAYKKLLGRYAGDGFTLVIDRVQPDPYAAPSKIRMIISRSAAPLPGHLLDTPEQRTAVADFLTRDLHAQIGAASAQGVFITAPGQQVLPRTAAIIDEQSIELRMTTSLPAAGRRIKGRSAARLLCRSLPEILRRSALAEGFDEQALSDQVQLYEDQLALQKQLEQRGLIGFVGTGSILPRQAGDSDLPLQDAVPFITPESLLTHFTLPSGRTVAGMGIPRGVTVIVGGGYHGKSTLLRALERGVHPHVGGDGREWVLTLPDAVTIRAEDGRAVTGTDISPFIRNLPSGADTRAFTTTNASGSTSQAANLAEALEIGTRAVLIDEDTSATNFMIRDEAMRALIPEAAEPITPFADRVLPLFRERGVSTVLVAGGSGAFFSLADHVIAMNAYVPEEVTERAREIAADSQTAASSTTAASSDEPDEPTTPQPYVFTSPTPRVPVAGALSPQDARKPPRGRGADRVQLGREEIDLSLLAQLVEPAQTQAVALAIAQVAEELDGDTGLVEAVQRVTERIAAQGPEVLSGSPRGDLAAPRAYEIHAAICRYRKLRVHEGFTQDK